MKLSRRTVAQVRAALREDIGPGDKTSNCLVASRAVARAFVLAKDRGVFCGESLVRTVIALADPSIRVKFFVRDGLPFRKRQTLFELDGKVRSILKIERTLLNFLARLCGIATATSGFVRHASPYGVRVLDTRKTTPLWRELEKYAVLTGGGTNHRMGLYDAVFVKENHRPFGDLSRLSRFHGQFVIEVRDFRELREAARYHPKSILLDNFPVSRLRKAVAWVRKIRPDILLEASGGITPANARRYAASGVDQISIGSLTHSVKAVDFSLLIKPMV
ncbi:MAG: carboxylating nicotinate-nucleotide diphosphorylase [Candidatus Omnitrophota bacterium]|jgi:nicotinate-nucleotide pyrophosphorylase (carboxylating)